MNALERIEKCIYIRDKNDLNEIFIFNKNPEKNGLILCFFFSI